MGNLRTKIADQVPILRVGRRWCYELGVLSMLVYSYENKM